MGKYRSLLWVSVLILPARVPGGIRLLRWHPSSSLHCTLLGPTPSFPRLDLHALSLGPSPRLTHIPTYPMSGEGYGMMGGGWDDVISMIMSAFVSILRGVNFNMHFVDNEAKVIHRTDGP